MALAKSIWAATAGAVPLSNCADPVVTNEAATSGATMPG